MSKISKLIGSDEWQKGFQDSKLGGSSEELSENFEDTPLGVLISNIVNPEDYEECFGQGGHFYGNDELQKHVNKFLFEHPRKLSNVIRNVGFGNMDFEDVEFTERRRKMNSDAGVSAELEHKGLKGIKELEGFRLWSNVHNNELGNVFQEVEKDIGEILDLGNIRLAPPYDVRGNLLEDELGSKGVWIKSRKPESKHKGDEIEGE